MAKWKWLSVVARVFLTGDTVKKCKCDRCGTDLEKIKMEKSVEYLCADCTIEDIRKLCAEILATKADEVTEQVVQIKESTETIRGIFKGKK